MSFWPKGVPLKDLVETAAVCVVGVLAIAGALIGFPRKKETKVGREGTVADGDGALPKGETVLEKVLATRTLRVGTVIAEPMFHVDADDAAPTGIYPAIFTDIADRNDLHVIYSKIKNHEVFDWLESGRVDVVAELLLTEQRSARAQYAALIHNVALVAVTKRGETAVECAQDLRKRTIRCAVVKGEIGAEIASSVYNIPDERLMVLDTFDVPAVFYMVRATADVTITTAARWFEFQERDPETAAGLHPVCDPLMLVPAGSLVRKGEDDLKLWLEREIGISRTAPQVRLVEDEWLSPYDGAVVRL